MTKLCSKCKEYKPITEFNKNKTKKDGLQQYCKICDRLHMVDRYKKNKDTIKENNRTRRVNRRNDIKLNLCCSICGESHPATLDFHHKDPNEKESNISALMCRNYGYKKIINEISKCIVLCANCHRKIHYIET